MLERHTCFPIPSLDPVDLPVAVHRCSLDQALARFGSENPRRRALGAELTKIFNAAFSTGHLARFIVFGSFVTAKEKPNDIDIFLMMDDEFEISEAAECSKNLFHHRMAQTTFRASIFWLRRKAALGGEDSMIENWQIKRDGTRRGIIEITTHPK